jgi:phosphatidylinositol glycan class U
VLLGTVLTRRAAQRVDDLSPNMGLWWYFFAEIFEHFRAFFIFVFHAQSILLLVPLTIRLQQTPLVLAVIACMLMALFKARPFLRGYAAADTATDDRLQSYTSVSDLALCTALLPVVRSEARLAPPRARCHDY